MAAWTRLRAGRRGYAMAERAEMIRFWCKCGARLKAPARDRGRSLHCPQCKAQVICPQQSTREPSAAAPKAAAPRPSPVAGRGVAAGKVPPPKTISVEDLEEESGGYEVQSAPAARPSGPPPLPGVGATRRVGPGAAPAVEREVMCPQCSTLSPADSLLCLNCGYNFRTGRQIEAARRGRVRTAGFGEFVLALVKAFVYPFEDLGNIARIAFIVSLVMIFALVGLVMFAPAGLAFLLAVAGYYGAYAINIIQNTLEGYDRPPDPPALSGATLLMPLLWLLTVAVVLGGPAALATRLTAGRPELAGLPVAAWVFAYIAAPMAILVISGAGSIHPRVIKGIFVSLVRNPGHYIVFLVLLGAAGIAALQIVGYLGFTLSRTMGFLGRLAMQFISMIVPLYLLAVYARMLGLFGRYREGAIDFGEGTKRGVHPAVGAVCLMLFFGAFTAGGYFGVERLREWWDARVQGGGARIEESEPLETELEGTPGTPLSGPRE